MALLILALLQRIFLMSSLMLLLVWLIFFMVLIKLNHTRSSISDDIRNILCSSANMRRAIPQRIFLMSSLMLLLVWLIFFMVLIKLLPILGTISGKTVKLMVL